MKRLAALLTATLLGLTAFPASAQASADPVSVLRAQFAKNRGVTITERDVDLSRKSIGARAKIIVQFARSGVVASDQTIMTLGYYDKPQHLRNIYIGGRGYTQGNIFNEEAPRLPEGKEWLLTKGKVKPSVSFLQFVNVLEPSTLGLLLKTTASVRRDGSKKLYAGIVSLRDLHKVSPSLQDSFAKELGLTKAKLNWRLWIDAQGRVSRLLTWEKSGLNTSNVRFDTRFSNWSSGVAIEAPPADEVATKEVEDSE